jgi:hypothetical protein
VNTPEPSRADAPARESDERERSLATLSVNEQWVADNYDKTVHAAKAEKSGKVTLAASEERILRCLGAALLMRWNTLPTKLQKELFDNAGSIGDALDATALRGQIARFLHTHKDDEDETVGVSR